MKNMKTYFWPALLLTGMLLLAGCGKKQESYVSKEKTVIGAVTIGGEVYTPKQNLETFLLMGVDSRGEISQEISEYDGTGQVDVLELLVIDKAANTYGILTINRDTICQVHSYSEEGEDLGLGECQISFAHTKGTTQTMRCENTVEAVEGILYGGIDINGYMSLQMDSIGVINHLAGGVTVTIEDDFSESDPTLIMGETVTLTDEQAYHYVHDRKNAADGTNLNRIRRQKTYMDAAKTLLMDKCRAAESYAQTCFDTLAPYMVTDLTGKDVSRIVKAMLKNTDLGYYEIEGVTEVDELGFIAYTMNEDNRREMITELFYEKP